jgi:hypothetical protein
MCCQDRTSSSIFFHSSALRWSFLCSHVLLEMRERRGARNRQHDRQTTDLVEKLRAQNIGFEELIFPDEIHELLRWRDWIRAYHATAEFFDRRLAASGPRQ